MIEEIQLNEIATYPIGSNSIYPKKVNYFYGRNGSGKTSLGNFICNPNNYSKSILKWKNNNETEILAYNKKFVKDNFSDKSRIQGIFTFGTGNATGLEKVDDLRNEKKEQELKLLNIKNSIVGIEQQTAENINNSRELIWKFKKDYADKIKELFKGSLSSQANFMDYIISNSYYDSNKTFIDISNEYELLYSSNIVKRDELALLDISNLISISSNEILKEKIEGKEEITISNLISKLDNSNWVSVGKKYLSDSNNLCPFCQQDLTKKIIQDLNDYFDETYLLKIGKIKEILIEYTNEADNIKKVLDSILLNNEFNSIKIDIMRLKENIDKNIDLLKAKEFEPKMSTVLISLDDDMANINKFINNYNSIILKNNLKLDKLDDSKKELIRESKNFIYIQSKKIIEQYFKKNDSLSKARSALEGKKVEYEEKILNITNEIKDIENSIKGIDGTISEINKILDLFGFKSFFLKPSNEIGKYQIVRKNGASVGDTLSDGEANFISFLYYYNLINGSQDEETITRDKILLIDDPVSSLDGETIFIVTTLLKQIISNCFEKESNIKQIFIFTHNVYFYREITYRGAGDNKKENFESYFLINKKNEISKITEEKSNPIKSTYQLLWDQVKNESDSPYLCNVMRRILEHYFYITGEMKYEKIIDKIDGEEKIVCKSLLSFLNDGSHNIYDDFNISFDNDKYKEVFRKVFEKSNHIGHYNMMMKIDDIEQKED